MVLKSALALFLSISLALGLAACSGEADVNLGGDTTDNDSGIIDLTPGDTTADDTVGGNDTGTVGEIGAEVSSEAVEKLVEAQLLISDGFKNVKVESETGGVIVLTGTVASEAEKSAAEAEARKVAGVKDVRNQITIGS